jgi:hypothetical protein
MLYLTIIFSIVGISILTATFILYHIFATLQDIYVQLVAINVTVRNISRSENT